MSVDGLLESIRSSPKIMENVTQWKVIPGLEGDRAPFPADLHPTLAAALRSRGIEDLYSHQVDAWRAIRGGKGAAIVTPTASGKTLCYNLPILQEILSGEKATALYLFPTKALSRDQVDELNGLIETVGKAIPCYTYDGDTPGPTRRTLRERGQIIVTNPYMLHTGILPNHPKWTNLFPSLRYVVIDELHSYGGVFGSHVANVIRRLRRVAAHYGASPQFITCSATIANPKALAEALTGVEMELIARSGAPRGEKHFLLYNPPIVEPSVGLRANHLEEVRRLAGRFAALGLQTIYFVRTRSQVEILTRYLKEMFQRKGLQPERVRGYRGGYLPNLRREIETGLRTGEVLAVVSTNALELGIDIGSLDVCILGGYPGSISSLWQQAGRAGRRSGRSLVLMVGKSNAIDQYIMSHPDYLFRGSPEEVRIQPDNPLILTNQIKCSAFELPFREGESFGDVPPGEVGEILRYLGREARILTERGGVHYWMAPFYPAEGVSLEATDLDIFIVHDAETGAAIGTVDRPSAPFLCHEGAIFGVQGETYEIDSLDYDGRIAQARKVDVDYYTEAEGSTEIKILHEDEVVPGEEVTFYRGEVFVSTQALLYKKIRFYTRENLGAAPIHLPPEEMDTTAFWIVIPRSVADRVGLYDSHGGGALIGVGNLFRRCVPLFLKTDPADVRLATEVASKKYDSPCIYLYDRYPSGVGLAEKAFEVRREILHVCREIVSGCPCEAGCPACTGTPAEVGPRGKDLARSLISLLDVCVTG